MDINSDTVFFYGLILLSFILIFKGAGAIKLKERDSFSRKHLVMYMILCSIIFIVSMITIFAFSFGKVNWIYAIICALSISLSTATFVKEDKIQEHLSKKKDLKVIPKRRIINEHDVAFEKRKTEESIILFIVPLAYMLAILLPQIIAFSQEMIIYKIVDFITAIAIGIISGMIIIAIRRKHIIILLTIGTCTFIIGDAITKIGLLSVVACAIFYKNINHADEISQKEKNKEERDMYRVITILQIVTFIGLLINFIENPSIPAIIIAAIIIIARAIFKEINLSVSLIPLAAVFCIERIFPEIEGVAGIVMSVIFLLMSFSVIINIKDIVLKIKNALKVE